MLDQIIVQPHDQARKAVIVHVPPDHLQVFFRDPLLES
jgi:hypothetical protein